MVCDEIVVVVFFGDVLYLYNMVCEYAERTNSLVAFLSIGALLVCVSLAVFQVWSLRKFFKRKKVL